MSSSSASGEGAFQRWTFKPNMDVFVKRRLWEANIMSEAATANGSSGSSTHQPTFKNASTQRMNDKWDALYETFQQYLTAFWPVLCGYLTLLEEDFEALDTVEGTLHALQSHVESLAVFGAKAYLGSMFVSLRRYLENEPTSNLDRGAFVHLIEAIWYSMPKREPQAVQKELEEKLGKQLEQEDLRSFTVKAQSTRPRHSFLSRNYWSGPRGPEHTLAQFEDKIADFNEAGEALLQAAAVWKVAVYVECSSELNHKPFYVVPQGTMVDEDSGIEIPYRRYKRQRTELLASDGDESGGEENEPVTLQTVIESATRRLETMGDT